MFFSSIHLKTIVNQFGKWLSNKNYTNYSLNQLSHTNACFSTLSIVVLNVTVVIHSTAAVNVCVLIEMSMPTVEKKFSHISAKLLTYILAWVTKKKVKTLVPISMQNIFFTVIEARFNFNH